MKVNYDRTGILKLGSIRDMDLKFTTQKPYKWTKDPVKILDIWLTNDSSNLFNLNITPQLQKTDNLIKIWNNKNMTLHGSVIIAKAFLISQLFYCANCLHINTLFSKNCKQNLTTLYGQIKSTSLNRKYYTLLRDGRT